MTTRDAWVALAAGSFVVSTLSIALGFDTFLVGVGLALAAVVFTFVIAALLARPSKEPRSDNSREESNRR
jgi:membrane protein implicated in regulation of membrane protease activity